jgi:hypothetical protein
MKKNYVLKTFCTLCLSCLVVVVAFFATNLFSSKDGQNYDFQMSGFFSVQNSLKHPIQVQVSIENTELKQKISSVSFEDRFLDLKNVSNHAHPTFHLNLLPGKYTISWQVDREQKGFIQKKTYSQTFTIDKTKLWVFINIKGDVLTIN